MKRTIGEGDFLRAFEDAGRGEQFSRAGLRELFGYLEDMEEETGTEIELDVIALCCEFAEYSTAIEAADDFGWEAGEDAEDAEEQEKAAFDWLVENTRVIPHEQGIIVEIF